jgi:hypothetical protein
MMTGQFVRLMLALWGVSLAALLGVRLLDGHPGSVARGGILYYGARLGCTGCHRDALFGPAMEGIAGRVRAERLVQNPGVTAAQYLAESIVDPGRYIVPGYEGTTMPRYTSNRAYFGLTIDELRDLVAYLMTREDK